MVGQIPNALSESCSLPGLIKVVEIIEGDLWLHLLLNNLDRRPVDLRKIRPENFMAVANCKQSPLERV